MEERGRIVTAIAKAVGEYGYSQLTVEQVLACAGVAPEEFDAHFENLEQGLSAAQGEFLERLRLEVDAACDPGRAWPGNVRAALGAALAYIADANTMARGLVVEATASSLAASERQYVALEAFADLLRQGRRLYPRAAEMPPETERALVGGVASIISDRLRSEEPRALIALEPQLAEFLLLPYLGRTEAGKLTRS